MHLLASSQRLTLWVSIVLLIMGATGSLQAQLTWGVSGHGGSGTWDSSTADWYDGTSNVTWTAGDSAIFTDSGGTVQISGLQSAAQLTFNSPGYTLSGGILEGTASGLAIDTNFAATINSALLGIDSSNLTLSGSGSLTLGGSASGFAQVTVNGGDLIIASPSAVSAGTIYNLSTPYGTSLTLAAGAGESYVIGGLNGGGGGKGALSVNYTSAGTGTLIIAGSGSSSYAGTLQDNDGGSRILALTVAGGAQTLTAMNTYSGATTITSGTLTLSGGGAIAGSPVSVAGGTLLLDNSGTNSTNRLSPTKNFSIAGGTFSYQGNASAPSTQAIGQLVLPSSGSTVTVNAGTGQIAKVTFNGISRSNAGGTVNFTGTGTTQITGSANTNGILESYATVNGTDWATVDVSGNVSAYASYASNINTATSVSNVRLVVGSLTASRTINSLNMQSPSMGTATLTLGNNTLTLGSGGLLSSGIGANSVATGNLTAANGELLITNFNTQTINANIVDSSGSVELTKSGTGTLNLAGSNTYTGATTVDQGTLRLSAPNTLPTSNVSISSGGTLDLNGSTAAVKSLSGSGSVTLGAGSLIINSSQIPGSTYSGTISGTGGLGKYGGGSSTLSGANTYTGSTQIYGGTLSLVEGQAASPVLASTGALLLSGGTLQVDTMQSGIIQQLGTLGLQGNSTINFSNTLSLTFKLAFADSSAQSWGTNQLVIANFNPTIDT